MGKRHFIAVYTDSELLIGCAHKHQNVATAVACISQPGGYIVAVRRRKFLPLTQAEEAEFEKAMYGREVKRHTAEVPLFVKPLPKTE